MSLKLYLGITLVSLILLVALTSFQSAPGYMDAEYYYSMGLRIAKSQGLSEPFIWNYLSGTTTIPHPGFTYWMPLPAFLTALGLWVSGLEAFVGGKIFHILLSALVPALTMKVVWERTNKSSEAILAGLLAVSPVFYSIFSTTTDSFAIVILLGGIFILLARQQDHWGSFVGMGIIAGLMHLTRADGMIWILAGLYCAIRAPSKRGLTIISVVGGYLLCMVPWYGRNLIQIGSIMPAGISSSFWLKEYDELFTYSTIGLSYKSWIGQGIKTILETYLNAGIANLKTAFLVQGQIILAPFMILGAWKNRRDIALQAILIVWLCVFLLMSIVFPFAGLRGGYFHSSAAFQILLWSLASHGFFMVIDWGVEKRGWTSSKAGKVFGAVLVAMIFVASSYMFSTRVIGGDFENPVWNASYLKAKQIAADLEYFGIHEDDLVMINNPPGFYTASARSSVVIPNGSVDTVVKAAKELGAIMLILEANHPAQLDSLYEDPSGTDQLEWIHSKDGVHFFLIADETP